MYKINNLTKSTIPLQTEALLPGITFMEEFQFNLNSFILRNLEAKGYVSIYLIKETEVTTSTSVPTKRGRKSKSNKGD